MVHGASCSVTGMQMLTEWVFCVCARASTQENWEKRVRVHEYVTNSGPILHPRNLLSTITHVSLLVCTWRKADFPPQKTHANTLAPGEACRQKQRRVPAQIILGAILVI